MKKVVRAEPTNGRQPTERQPAGGGVAKHEFFILPVHSGLHRGAEVEKGLLAAVVAEGGLGDGGSFAGDTVLALLC